MTSKSSPYVIIVGCGLTGSFLARLLSSFTEKILVVDKEPSSLPKLPEGFSDEALAGDTQSEQVVIDERLKEADMLIVATEDEDYNVILAIRAKRLLGITKVITAISHQKYVTMLQKMGIDSFTCLSPFQV